jgi:hypothetical protein
MIMIMIVGDVCPSPMLNVGSRNNGRIILLGVFVSHLTIVAAAPT